MRKNMIEIRRKFLTMGIGDLPPAIMRETLALGVTSERGIRATPENSLAYLYRRMWVDPDLRQAILDVREQDRMDGRVKKIHKRMASGAVKGGLRLAKETNKRILRRWEAFMRRLQLDRREKLESDARGLVMEGNLPLQWVLGADNQVVAGIRMPSETILPNVGMHGRLLDPANAYWQIDPMTGGKMATFALWQLSMARLTPDSFDDQGALGRPYLDASRAVWKKLTMTEEDLVIRRHTRAAQKLAHVLEGANDSELDTYRLRVEGERDDVNTDYYLNKKGSVVPVQGDANLDQIADVNYLLDTFFAGAPAPKGLFGYAGDLSRDILEDLKRDFFEELDAMQDVLAFIYEQGFNLDLLLAGINPDEYDFEVKFAERQTETPNQAADRALKLKAVGASNTTVWETAGLDATAELELRDMEASSSDPYPSPNEIGAGGGPGVSITPGNARKGESGTAIANQ